MSELQTLESLFPVIDERRAVTEAEFSERLTSKFAGKSIRRITITKPSPKSQDRGMTIEFEDGSLLPIESNTDDYCEGGLFLVVDNIDFEKLWSHGDAPVHEDVYLLPPGYGE